MTAGKSMNKKKFKIDEKFNCTCGFVFEVQTSDENYPRQQILGIVLARHQTGKHKLTHTDFNAPSRPTDAEKLLERDRGIF